MNLPRYYLSLMINSNSKNIRVSQRRDFYALENFKFINGNPLLVKVGDFFANNQIKIENLMNLTFDIEVYKDG